MNLPKYVTVDTLLIIPHTYRIISQYSLQQGTQQQIFGKWQTVRKMNHLGWNVKAPRTNRIRN